jgi:PAS domain S-box-containing protein
LSAFRGLYVSAHSILHPADAFCNVDRLRHPGRRLFPLPGPTVENASYVRYGTERAKVLEIIGSDRRFAMNGTRSLSRLTSRKVARGNLSLVSDRSPILLGSVGLDGRLKFLNPAWEELLGYSRDELQDLPLCELMQHERPVAVALMDQLLGEDSFERMEFGLRCKDGTCKWLLWHRRFDWQNRAIFVAAYDITEQKNGEVASILRSYERSAGKFSPSEVH